MRRGGWGWVIFLLVVLGPQLLPPVARALSQATGLPISTGGLLAGLIGVYVAVSALGALGRGLRRSNESGGPSVPTQPTQPQLPYPPPRPPRGGPSLPSPMAGAGARRPPGPPPPTRAPGFEPIVDPRVLVAGVVGLVVIGGLFGLALLLLGATPP